MSGDFDPVSLTIESELLAELDEVIDEWEYASRSEAVRDAVRGLLTEYRWRTNLSGPQRGSVVVVHDHHVGDVTDEMLDIQHESLDLITAVQHVHLSEHLCLETLVVDGSGAEVRKLVNRLQSLRGVRQVELALVTE
jgi:CopG family nickel-responsive transcriptional regulator